MSEFNSAEWIKANRERLKITQLKLAVLVKSDPGTVSRWETGESTPRAEKFVALCIAFGIDPGAFEIPEPPVEAAS